MTRKVVWLLVVTLACLVVVSTARTMMFASKQLAVSPVAIEIDAAGSAQRLAGALRFSTVSQSGSGANNAPAFLQLHDYLHRQFPRVHRSLTREVISNYSLLYRWAGSAPELEPVLLAAHIDVVPAGSDDDAGWQYPPFAGTVAQGFVWGRGAMDDKVGVTAILEAIEWLLALEFQPRRTVYLAFGHDEEVGGAQGAAQIAAHLAQQGVRLQFVLDEGMMVTEGIVPGVAEPVALIGIAEKGYADVELVATAAGGHTSIPPSQTAAGIVAGTIARLERSPMPARLADPARQLFEHAGPEMSFAFRMLFANLWLFEPLVLGQLAAQPATNAVIRTTAAPTMLRGSERPNVLPASAAAVVNYRILPGDTIDDVLEHVRRTVDDDRVTVQLYTEDSHEPSTQSSTDSSGFRAIERSIREVFAGTIVAPALVVPATDARHYAQMAADVYRFAPLRVGSEDLARFHGTDE
ncbi:MAG: M20 family peptidase, partial [Pseudomonadota bacterium]